jgi:hypothetical protein
VAAQLASIELAAIVSSWRAAGCTRSRDVPGDRPGIPAGAIERQASAAAARLASMELAGIASSWRAAGCTRSRDAPGDRPTTPAGAIAL